MTRAIFLGAIFLLITSAAAQTVTDDDKRGFGDLDPILIDVDGDAKPDKIQPRTYQTYKRRPGQRLKLSAIQNWITFDLTTSRGKRIRSFFTYNYGTAENGGSYWVYALIPAGDLNKDGWTDLTFYTGDDTGDETVTLASRKGRYIVRSRVKTHSDDWINDPS